MIVAPERNRRLDATDDVPAPVGSVQATTLGDGILVRVQGHLGLSALPDLREALLAPRPLGCDDVIVDAGRLTAICDDALAVLVAAHAWALATGGQFRLSAVSPALRDQIDALDLTDALPPLPTTLADAPAPRACAAE